MIKFFKKIEGIIVFFRRWPLLMLCVFMLLSVSLAADDGPTKIEGEAILKHSAGKAIIGAAQLLSEGKLGEVRKNSAEDVKAEWLGMSKEEQTYESERAQKRAPDPKSFEKEIANSGVLTIYGESATLRVGIEDSPSAMAFVVLENGKWLVTGGPMTFEPPLIESEPAIEKAAILDHEIGKLVLEYAKRLSIGNMDSVHLLLSPSANANRAALPPGEDKKSDQFRVNQFAGIKDLKEAIKSGGIVQIFGDKASFNLVTNTKTENADGSTSFTSETTSLPFEKVAGKWMIAD